MVLDDNNQILRDNSEKHNHPTSPNKIEGRKIVGQLQTACAIPGITTSAVIWHDIRTKQSTNSRNFSLSGKYPTTGAENAEQSGEFRNMMM
ncbi:hypothetical protein SNEBB_003098 [Seison nebaliae]|nr:hypothetical protein SNEBB_003098 [Seison nebaliae]